MQRVFKKNQSFSQLKQVYQILKKLSIAFFVQFFQLNNKDVYNKKMSNIHGLNDYSNQNRQNRNRRQQQINSHSNTGLSMLGITQQDLAIMGNEIANNRVPFINIMADDVEPLQQSIPYTLKIVWCPAFSILTFSTLVLLTIWVMYIVCLCHGIDTMHYDVLAPTSQTLRKFGAFNYQLLKDGQVWRLIAAAFLHQDLLQITMSSISILFFVTQLQQCYNPLIMGLLMIVSAISGNITTAVFGDMITLNAGSGVMVYGVMGGFFAYMTINWDTLFLIRTQICCLIGIMVFFAMLFSIGGIYGFASFCGAFIGGYACSLAIFPGIRPKHMLFTIAGAAGVGIYWLTMFLIFYLAV